MILKENYLDLEFYQVIKKEMMCRSMIYLGIYLIFIFPIIRSNYFYIDDLGRSLDGHTNWSSAGRPFASFLMEAVNFNRWTVTDIAPLPQILSIILLSVASAWTSIFYRLRFGFGMLPIALIVCSPFFLENLSYRFDSLTMGAAVCLAMFPFGLSILLSNTYLYLGTSLAIFISLNLYQPALNVFIVLTFFSALTDVKNADIAKASRTAFFRLLCLAAALIAYKTEEFLFPFDRYASKHAGLTLDNIQIIFHNLGQAYSFLARNLFHTHQTQLLIVAMLFGIPCFFVGLYHKKSSGKKTDFALSAMVSLVFLGGMLGGILGPIILLRSPIWASRVMIGFGALGACLVSLAVLELQETVFSRYISIVLCIILFGEFTISFAYGNALHAQALLDGQIARNITEDAYILSKGKPSSLMVNGVEPRSPNARLTTETYPIVKTLLPLPLHGAWYWGGTLLKIHGLPGNIRFMRDRSSRAKIKKIFKSCKIQAVVTNLYYNIYKDGHYLIVDFTKRCFQSRTTTIVAPEP